MYQLHQSMNEIMKFVFLSFLFFATAAEAWMPTDRNLFNASTTKNASHNAASSNFGKRYLRRDGKIRGVNLGSMFIFEPWMARQEWDEMGCGGTDSEFDCVMKLGQAKANAAFAAHWDRWITKDDIDTIRSYGLNTIRIPVGYWMHESIIYEDSEYFPRGGFKYLEKICGCASNKGLYIIIDLHGAPGAQVAKKDFTGQV
jgi:aryl-phospho-beta-D-glucosidase BglC (GH1 family)